MNKESGYSLEWEPAQVDVALRMDSAPIFSTTLRLSGC